MELEDEIKALLNCHSAENVSNTPDWLLAQYLLSCLAAFNTAVQQRENWYGRDLCSSFDQQTTKTITEPDDGFSRSS